ncbi:uncharacterized protein BO97DRAFT_333425 [Aspergillus homomorphus CBS 101889]|uniref:Epidermal growth factor receptor-like transmembrane-juxtamembrane segment domain-containing protein n=1 Tax=Aspergillus homomorphus (strain CBS 101889) TaxID=1450537 RepID=A0A395IE49_ASPHC|nr:hypothetical protein BO97DRAFT_333425 [Aspergillus homomorphus CBS 101889]RAL17428.1 hypothetical protein BO97DRAFT_333425 [Aspergillus homomorphus CBS 101889]
MTNATAGIQGFASRRNNTCLEDEVSCGHTWGTQYACCPSGSYCPGSKVSIPNNVCCPSWTDCTAQIDDPPVCADSSWGLYNYSGYFCCEGDTQGFGVKGETWVGCAAQDYPGNAKYSALNLIAQETGTTTAIATTTAATTASAGTGTVASVTTPPTSSSLTATASAVPTSHGTNSGAIAGGVVGGVLGVAAIAAGLWFFLRRRKTQTPQQPVSQAQHSEYMYAAEDSNFSELNAEPDRIELVGHKNQLRHELPG